MVDIVTTEYIYNQPIRKMIHLTNVSDGTGESGVTKVDISTLLTPIGDTCTYTKIEWIDYSINGFTSVRLYWDHTTDDEIVLMPTGDGTAYFSEFGGKVDPRSAGGTGDILLTTAGTTSGNTYDIRIHFKCKA